MSKHAFVVAVALLILAGPVGSRSPATAETWPQRAVRIVVPTPPGTALDVVARLYGDRLSARWKHPVIIENIPGTDGIVAIKEFLARNDQHTLFYCHAGPISINPLLYEKLPYDPMQDLVPISTAADNFLTIAVPASLNANSLADLGNVARSRANELSWTATPGLTYFAFAAFLQVANISMTHVGYRNLGQAVADLGEGRIHAISTSIAPLRAGAQAGKLRLLAVINRARAPIAPDVPTAVEQGFPELSFDGVSVYGWRTMSSELRERIAGDLRLIAADGEIAARLASTGAIARAGTPAEFTADINAQRSKVAAIAQALGTRPIQ